jgi:hypothetical protein
MPSRSFLSGVIGGVIGFFVGGPAGAAKGFLYGYQAGTLLFPEDLPDAPLLEDKNRIRVDPGEPLNLLHGIDGVSPSTVMYLGARSTSSTEVVVVEGIIGSLGEQTQTVFNYFQTIALHLADCSDGYPISGLWRVWEDGEVVYDVRPRQPDEDDVAYTNRLTASAAYAQTFVLYSGTESQLPDPTIETEQGAGNVPAWRGDAYIVYPRWQLDPENGHQHPVRKFELVETGEMLLTSRPYPYYASDSLQLANQPVDSQTGIVLAEGIDVGFSVLGGTLQTALASYDNYIPEEIDLGFEVLGGTLVTGLATYDNYLPEELDLGFEVLGGTLVTGLVSYDNYAPEEIDLGFQVLGGTLTTP